MPRPSVPPGTECENPDCSRLAGKRFRKTAWFCPACYQYASRHDGALRTEEQIVAFNLQQLYRDVERRREQQLAADGMVEQYPEG